MQGHLEQGIGGEPQLLHFLQELTWGWAIHSCFKLCYFGQKVVPLP